MTDTDTAPGHAFEGRKSAKGQLWQMRPYSERLAGRLVDIYGLPLPLARLLAARGVDADAVTDFLKPSLKTEMPDPSVLQDMDKAADLLADAVIADKRITIFGDYDVDGATSSALLIRTFAALGVKAGSYIPDRMREGYGPSVAAIEALAADGVELIITVDCGTLSYDPLRRAADLGVQVMVLDHHKAETQLPIAAAVVNPNRLDDESGLGSLAAVGVCFMTAVALVRTLRSRGFFQNRPESRPDYRAEPDLMAMLDLVALGTVADVVPLVGLNRVFVAQGLKVMAKRRNVGLTALSDVASISEPPGAYHLGFLLGPRVNAGGRVGESSLGTALLTTDDPDRARSIAQRLDRYNIERREIEAEVLADATAKAGHILDHDPDRAVLVVGGEGWHPGVIGIVAGRLKEAYRRPAIVVAFDGDEGKASARSISGVDIGAATLAAVDAGVLVKGGGHAMAAGMTVMSDQMAAFQDFVENHLRADVLAAQETAAVKVDGTLSLTGAQVGVVEHLEKAGPFGMGNANPRFVFQNVTLIKADIVGGDHLRCIVQSGDGKSAKAMAFREADGDIGRALLGSLGADFHILARVKIDNWGRVPKTELIIEDVMPV